MKIKLCFLLFAVLWLVACDNPKPESSFSYNNNPGGYTEEENARLATWEPKVQVDTSAKLWYSSDSSVVKTWYDVDFETAPKQLLDYTDEVDSSRGCQIYLYENENGVRLQINSLLMQLRSSEVLSRDGYDAISVDRVDNYYSGMADLANCRADSSKFVIACADNGGSVEDMLQLDQCYELHLTCRMKFFPMVTAGDYLNETARFFKKSCEDVLDSLPVDTLTMDTLPMDTQDTDTLPTDTLTTDTLTMDTLPVDSFYGDSAFKDGRDGRVYKIVTIGSQLWMAENLKYDSGESSVCYDNDEDNCETYGRMYTWEGAVNLRNEEASMDSLETVQGACPGSWLLPTLNEFQELFNYAGANEMSLMSVSGWNSVTGLDTYGFNMLPGGQGSDGVSPVFSLLGEDVYYWTASPRDAAYVIDGTSFDSPIFFAEGYRNYVRCVRDTL